MDTAPPRQAPDDTARQDPRTTAGEGNALATAAPRRRWPVVVALVAVLVVGGGIWWWLGSGDSIGTADARIAGDVTQMAPQVGGRVTALLFTDNQHVAKGQPLVEIDTRDLQAALDQKLAQQATAEAQVAQAEAQLRVRQADLDQAQANVTVADATLTAASKDYQRYQHINPAAVMQQQRDQVDAAYRSATARRAAAQQAVEGAQAQIAVAKALAASAQSGVRQAEAAVAQARLQLSYATITAPVAGRVTHRTVNLGDVVQPGQPMFALVQDTLWVEADFKETELAGMKPGDPATIRIDAVPGVTFHGIVDSFQQGTGAAFSALPAENATGNWVKVVQRVPVKIRFGGDAYRQYFLAPGMSAEPSVKLR